MKPSFFVLVVVALMQAACAVTPSEPAHPILTPLSFDGLAGWKDDAPLDALVAFRISCNGPKTNASKSNADAWHRVCASARQTADDNDAARGFFENAFTLYAITSNGNNTGLFTGYYVPELQGSLQRDDRFQTPLYGHPSDRIDVDLGTFKSSLKGQHITGKIAGGKLVPYDDRAAIERSTLTNRAPVLAWVDDPIGAFFLHIQGSGRIRLTDDSILPVGYDGTNGRAYIAIGRVLADRGDLGRPVTMPAIRAWLTAHPDQAQEIMNTNPSYVFFRRLPTDAVIGAQGVALTPRRSLAVDPAFIPLGAPLWLDTTDARGNIFQHLMVAQDTGGAIKGIVRGDVFWGAGDEAAIQAGAMQSPGHYDLLLPKGVQTDE